MTLPEPPLPDFAQLLRAMTAAPVKAAELVDLPPGFSASLFKRGSLAMAAAVKTVQQKTGAPRLAVWIPDYFCNDALHPIRKLNVELIFYPVNADLSVDWEAAGRLFDENAQLSIFVLVHYFGFPNQTHQARQFCDERSIGLMEDAAHCLVISSSMGSGDFMIFSPRKLLPAPFGGVLAAQLSSTKPAPQPADAAAGQEVRRWLCRRIIQKSLNTLHIPWHFLPAYQHPPATEASSNGTGREKPGCDPYVRRLLSVLISGRDAVIRKRRANYQMLSRCVIRLKHVEPVVAELPLDVCPYVFPVRLSGKTSEIVAAFRKSGIPASRWPDLPPEVLRDAAAHRGAIENFERVILLPVHQGLESRDMERISWQLAKSLS